jgi:hypothetical protein
VGVIEIACFGSWPADTEDTMLSELRSDIKELNEEEACCARSPLRPGPAIEHEVGPIGSESEERMIGSSGRSPKQEEEQWMGAARSCPRGGG